VLHHARSPLIVVWFGGMATLLPYKIEKVCNELIPRSRWCLLVDKP
jgi:hypothetical protein